LFACLKGSSGNLFGTIRSLDLLQTITLNCSENAGKKVHGEQLHCAFGLISRLGFVVSLAEKCFILCFKFFPAKQQGVAVFDDTDSFCLASDLSFWQSPNREKKGL
jgi:hypothetical protein